VKIESFKHKGLKRFYEDGQVKGFPAASRKKLGNMLGFLDAMTDPAELLSPVLKWKAHELTGNRRGTWALNVTANVRLTFWVDDQRRLRDLNLEDYH
jgi:toxin HigB-1